jgi:hypothetical protein
MSELSQIDPKLLEPFLNAMRDKTIPAIEQAIQARIEAARNYGTAPQPSGQTGEWCVYCDRLVREACDTPLRECTQEEMPSAQDAPSRAVVDVCQLRMRMFNWAHFLSEGTYDRKKLADEIREAANNKPAVVEQDYELQQLREVVGEIQGLVGCNNLAGLWRAVMDFTRLAVVELSDAQIRTIANAGSYPINEYVGLDLLIDFARRVLKEAGSPIVEAETVRDAEPRRINACLNACAGIESSVLEQLTDDDRELHAKLIRINRRVFNEQQHSERQRDQLLDVLCRALPFVEENNDVGYKPGTVANMVKDIREAIAAASGEDKS